MTISPETPLRDELQIGQPPPPGDDYSQYIFTGTIRGEQLVADPIIVRHALLANTHGRAWSMAPVLKRLEQDIDEAHRQIAEITADLIAHPPTAEELQPPPPPPPREVSSVDGPPPPPVELPPPTRMQVLQQLEAQVAIALQRQSDYVVMLAQATAVSFGLMMFDIETRQGYTCDELIDLLGQYMVYAEKKGKRSST